MRQDSSDCENACSPAACSSGCRLDATRPARGPDSARGVVGRLAGRRAHLRQRRDQHRLHDRRGRRANAAEHIRDFVHSQLPCAEVTLEDATLTIEYGALPGNCTLPRPQVRTARTRSTSRRTTTTKSWSSTTGRTSTTAASRSAATPSVTWNAQGPEPARRARADLDAHVRRPHRPRAAATASQRPLAGGLRRRLRGRRHARWEGKRGRWDLDIDHVEMRWADPVPQAGSLVLHDAVRQDRDARVRAHRRRHASA